MADSKQHTVTVLHTSDWHIGRSLCNRSRHEEIERFLSWMVDTVTAHEVDVLLIAGDIFDTAAPSNRSQTLYYRFLNDIAGTRCHHVVVVGGNHDSPTFLDAPGAVLQVLNVHVVGAARENVTDEVLVLRDDALRPLLVVAAVPYLRDRDVRVSTPGEQPSEKVASLEAGIADHYATVTRRASALQRELGGDVPIVATGHLFAEGGVTQDDDGVRELYVGQLARVGSHIFPKEIDYVALGHLHTPQVVGHDPSRRYSGAPLPMGFGEIEQSKSVVVVTFGASEPAISTIDVPCFQKKARVTGEVQEILDRLSTLKAKGESIWVEIVHTGETIVGNLWEQSLAAAEGSLVEVLRVKTRRIGHRALGPSEPNETLDTLSVTEVFERCMAVNAVPAEQRDDIARAYREIVESLDVEDRNVE